MTFIRKMECLTLELMCLEGEVGFENKVNQITGTQDSSDAEGGVCL